MALISTGISELDRRFEVDQAEGGFITGFRRELTFTNLFDFMKSRIVVKHLTYRLLIHDLRARQGDIPESPFRIMQASEVYLENYSLDSLVEYMEARLRNFKDFEIEEQKEVDIEEIASSFNYDYESLLQSLQLIETNSKMDVLRIEFTSEDPSLSYFALSNYCNDFFAYYSCIQTYKYQETIEFFRDLVAKKKSELERMKNDSSQDQKYEISLLEEEYLGVKSILQTEILKLENTTMPLKLIQKATLPSNYK